MQNSKFRNSNVDDFGNIGRFGIGAVLVVAWKAVPSPAGRCGSTFEVRASGLGVDGSQQQQLLAREAVPFSEH